MIWLPPEPRAKRPRHYLRGKNAVAPLLPWLWLSDECLVSQPVVALLAHRNRLPSPNDHPIIPVVCWLPVPPAHPFTPPLVPLGYDATTPVRKLTGFSDDAILLDDRGFVILRYLSTYHDYHLFF